MASNKSTIITGGLPTVTATFLTDDGTKRTTIINGAMVEQLSGSPSGDWASTEALDTMSAVGWSVSSGPTGYFTPTELPDTMVAAGFVACAGPWSSIEQPDSFSAYLIQPLRAVWASTEKLDTFAGTGVGYGESIIWNSTEEPDVFAADGIAVQPVIGTFNVSEAPDRFRAFGSGVIRSTSPPSFFVT